MRTKSLKAKGRNLQNIVRDKLRHEWEGILDDDDIKGAIMGEGGEDLVLSPKAQEEIGMSFECKARASFSLYKHYDQAERNCKGRVPVLVIKADRKKPLVVVDMDWFLEMTVL